MKQGETGMSFRHAPGKLLVIGRFLEKIVSALLPFLTMLVSARFIDLVLNQRMEEAIRDACLLGALILCQRLGGNLDTWMRIHQRKVLFPYLDERMIGKISRIPYGFLENAEIQDALERVSKDPEEVLNGVLESGFSMVCFLISNGCLVVWLITQAPVWISPVIVVLLVSGVAVALLDAEMAGILQRYYADFGFMFLAAAVLLAFVVNENLEAGSVAKDLLMKVLIVLVAASVAYSALLCFVPETGWYSDIYPWAYQDVIETAQFWT